MPDIIFKVGPDIDFKPVVSEARKKERNSSGQLGENWSVFCLGFWVFKKNVLRERKKGPCKNYRVINDNLNILVFIYPRIGECKP